MDQTMQAIFSGYQWGPLSEKVAKQFSGECGVFLLELERVQRCAQAGDPAKLRKPRASNQVFYDSAKATAIALIELSKGSEPAERTSLSSFKLVLSDPIGVIQEVPPVCGGKAHSWLNMHRGLTKHISELMAAAIEHFGFEAAVWGQAVELSIRHKEMFDELDMPISEGAIRVWTTLCAKEISTFVLFGLMTTMMRLGEPEPLAA